MLLTVIDLYRSKSIYFITPWLVDVTLHSDVMKIMKTLNSDEHVSCHYAEERSA